MCSVVPLPFLKPACSLWRSSPCFHSGHVAFLEQFTCYGDWSNSLHFLKSAKFPFFGNLIILPCVQSSGSSSFSHISTKTECRISAAVSESVLKTSAHSESIPGALLFPGVAAPALMSTFFGGDVSISRSLSASWMSAGCCGSDLFSTSLKCSVHLRSCSSSLVSSHLCP